ncbi:MAG TPA: glycosyltransferase [Clostridiales bacterium]|nr:MAG: N-acetylmannosaminyltransferase [Clostridiales bacterium GWD2_32_59]HAN09981.1 glycosyltransferase [Clostridiales bacterium]
MSKVDILGVNIDRITMTRAVERVMQFLESDKLNSVYTPNPEFVMTARKDAEFKKILNEGALVIPDGIGVVYASRIMGDPLPERVPGYDLVMNVFKNLKYEKVYFLGAKYGVIKEAVENMKSTYKIDIVGYRDGYFGAEDEDYIIKEINALDVDLLLVGLGSPRQEKFIYKNRNKLKVKVAIGVGGCFDVMAGITKRAPVIFQKLGLEWFYRLLRQPSRFIRMLKLPEFMLIVIWKKIKNRESKTEN